MMKRLNDEELKMVIKKIKKMIAHYGKNCRGGDV